MSDENKPYVAWVLGGVTALLLAVASLLGVLHQIGVIGSTDKTSGNDTNRRVELVSIPNVVDMQSDKAKEILGESFEVVVTQEFHDTEELNKVLKVEPGVGEKIARGAKITLIVNKFVKARNLFSLRDFDPSIFPQDDFSPTEYDPLVLEIIWERIRVDLAKAMKEELGLADQPDLTLVFRPTDENPKRVQAMFLVPNDQVRAVLSDVLSQPRSSFQQPTGGRGLGTPLARAGCDGTPTLEKVQAKLEGLGFQVTTENGRVNGLNKWDFAIRSGSQSYQYRFQIDAQQGQSQEWTVYLTPEVGLEKNGDVVALGTSTTSRLRLNIWGNDVSFDTYPATGGFSSQEHPELLSATNSYSPVVAKMAQYFTEQLVPSFCYWPP